MNHQDRDSKINEMMSITGASIDKVKSVLQVISYISLIHQ